MKLIALSDLHLDKEEHRETGLETIDQVAQIPGDVLVVGGDVSQTKEYLELGLEGLSKFEGTKLAYLGNHELRINGFIGENYSRLKDVFEKYGFQLLDDSPAVVRNIGFVGNVGWYDLSLYSGSRLEEYREISTDFYKKEFDTRGINQTQFNQICFRRVKEHIEQVSDSVDKIVLGIHHVAFKEFLKYGHTEYFDFKNLFMGSTEFQEAYSHPKVAIGLCGHTHRSGRINYSGKPIYNISSDKKQKFLEIEI
ncbi:hypothetical protein HN587_04515 [Candidatus Woesearchaeota archaeon]|nr:hypothetical protein [Candidatus Woesearchaeota archaeon]